MTSQHKNICNCQQGCAGPGSSVPRFFTRPVVNWKEMETTKLTDSDSPLFQEHNLNIEISSVTQDETKQ